MQPDQPDAVQKLSHSLSIEGIRTSSVESNVKWLIEVSKNDLTTSSSGKILTYTDNSKISLLVDPSVVVANVPERAGGGGITINILCIYSFEFIMCRS